jgi:MYXO-CTERM domain-containing protein
MKCLWLVVVAMSVLVAAPVHAMDHEGRITEIQLSNANPAVQFIEITDQVVGGELYPNTPYSLEIFDAAGVSLGSVSLTLAGLHSKWYVATTAADNLYAPQHNDLLTIALPLNGQACFERSSGTSKIHCLAWGCITHLAQAVGESRSATPSDGKSAQLQANGTYQIGNPTPNDVNVAGTVTVPCASDPLDGPPLPDAGVPKDAPAGGQNTGDAGLDPTHNGGCCNVDGDRGQLGAFLLALGTLVTLRRRR